MSEERVTQSEPKKITLADNKEYLIKKLTLKEYKGLVPELQKLDELKASGPTKLLELIDQLVKVCYKILSPKHPDITEEKLYEILEVEQAWLVVYMGIGGPTKID